MSGYESYIFDRLYQQFQTVVGADVYTSHSATISVAPETAGVTKKNCTIVVQNVGSAAVELSENGADSGIIIRAGEDFTMQRADPEDGRYSITPSTTADFRVVYLQYRGGKHGDGL